MDTDRDITGTRSDRGEEKRFRRVLSAGTLEGDKVRNSAGEDLGKIEEIMIDIPTGRVAYAVLSFGGFMGIGDKFFAVPWEALTIDEGEKEFVLNVDKETLKSAPGFDKDNWPDMADPDWGSQIFNYYGYQPYWGASAGGMGMGRTRERERGADLDRDSTLKRGGV